MTAELFKAVATDDTNQARALLQGGADCNALNDEGVTLLMQAAQTGNLEMVKTLIESGADVNLADPQGWTALMKALYNHELNCGFPDVVQTLIDAGAGIETQIGYGIRPLMLAAGYGEAGVVEVLLKAGADVRAINEGGRTALMMVKDKDYIEVINQLHEAELELGDDLACGSRTPPGVNVVKFMKNPDH
ncbi:MAG TPA: ankyrin repeat domain-containing protein [Sulfuricella sp.]|nr:ankyrin repeat domain-containing protein [Sulfuricella sp.]